MALEKYNPNEKKDFANYLRNLANKIEADEVQVRHYLRIEHTNEIEPFAGIRQFKDSGEMTLNIIYRVLKNHELDTDKTLVR